MKESEVTLGIEATHLSLPEISSLLGRQCSSGSYEKGSQHGGREPSVSTVWRFDSHAGRTASMVNHFRDIASRLPASLFHQQGLKSADVKVCLNVAVYFDAAMCTVNLPPECVDIAKSYGSAVEVTCYPSSFDCAK